MTSAGGTQALFEALVGAALLGSERQPPPLAGAEGPLADLLARLDPADPAGALLGAAAAVDLYRRAGYPPRPVPLEAAPPACDRHDLSRVSDRAAAHLARMLAGEHSQVLPEWLEAAASAGRRAPEEQLPALLDAGLDQPKLQEPLLAVLGARGRWLAALNPRWHYAQEAAETPETEVAFTQAWETASAEHRPRLLARLRASNPALARQVLQESWSQESAWARAEFLAQLAVGLGPQDEPFLESALDDRSQTVRSAAVDLLARLPTSRLSQQTLERVCQLVNLKTGRAVRFEITLPQGCDQAMQRDGVDPKFKPPASLKLGQKAGWLLQMLRLVPPATWSRLWKQGPAELVGIAGKGKWRALLHGGWSEAILLHQDPDWAAALVAAVPQWAGLGLMEVLSPEACQALALEKLRASRGPLNDRHPAAPLLECCRQPWSASLTRAVLERLRGGSWHYRLPAFARYMDPALTDKVHHILREGDKKPTYSQPVDDCLALLAFRREMLKELAS